ncbi:kinase-like protein [Cadophora sp. DSE1049]|nr:kinase-like protein [Cadophora sp. DSE1049]
MHAPYLTDPASYYRNVRPLRFPRLLVAVLSADTAFQLPEPGGTEKMETNQPPRCDDNNVVAYIYPALGTEGHAGAALSIRINQKHPGYLPSKRRRPQALDLLHAPERSRADGGRGGARSSRLRGLYQGDFDQIPKTRFGLRTGRSGDAELPLASLPAVGFYHFALTFDDDYRLVIRDLGSTCGTAVIYGHTERGRWSKFDWIVGGSDFLEGVSPIIVKVSQLMQFRLVIPRHNVQSKSYRDKVDIFRAGTADPDHLLDLDRVGLSSRVRTEVPTGVQTPASQPATAVTVRKKLGQGSFAVVYCVWNVSSGEQHALKKPLKTSFDDAAWEREALIMDRIEHKHIVSLLNSRPGPAPWLHLEYMPEGSVDDQLEAGRFFSRYECKQILAQTSDALAYLHTLDPQVVHRDIKPSNILILYRRPEDIFVKFVDFGLSREGDNLTTICGTALYLAPEVYEASAIQREERGRYTALVDIWSLGVVVAQLRCGLPRHKEDQKGETTLGTGEDDLLSFVLQSMLCLGPDARKTAQDCHKVALRLLHSSNSGVSGGHCSDSLKNEASTIRPWEARKIDGEHTETGNGDPNIKSSSLSKYIFKNPQHVRSCIAPSPEIITVPVAQLVSQFDNPEDSLFWRSSFGDDSDESYGDGRGSSSASTVVIAYDAEPQDGGVGESAESVLGVATALETDDAKDAPLENEFREFSLLV